jgi:hypothetical protein
MLSNENKKRIKLTEFIIGKDILIVAPEYKCGKKVRVTIIGSLGISNDLQVNTISSCDGRIITINNKLRVCNLVTLDVFPCIGDTIYFHSKVAASPVTSIFMINPYSVFEAQDHSPDPATPNITLVIKPKGTGALITTEPDLTSTGGNNRGQNAVDLQMRRDLTTQVASGDLSVIGGGISNAAPGRQSTVSGGAGNTASATNSTVSGGTENIASGDASTIGGGQSNIASNSFATISGGVGNNALELNTTISGGQGNTASNAGSTIGGGANNISSGFASTIGGGQNNTSSNNSTTVGGGAENTASGNLSTIGGGTLNIASGNESTISGGQSNITSGIFSTVGGGGGNQSTGASSIIGGGQSNTVSANFTTISGGVGNKISGMASVISGGQGNTISGSFSVIPGGANNNALHDNTYVYGVFSGPTSSSATNQVIFNLQAASYTPPANTNEFFINGNFAVTGTKAFIIPHPILENRYLKHICVEAPKPDLIYRGTTQLVNGQVHINIDLVSNMTQGTFSKLTRNHQVFLTNKTNWDLIKVEDYNVLPTGIFTIISNNLDSAAVIDWMVVAERIMGEFQVEI